MRKAISYILIGIACIVFTVIDVHLGSLSGREILITSIVVFVTAVVGFILLCGNDDDNRPAN